MRILLLLGFYLFSIFNIICMLKFFNFTSRDKFRDEKGDITTEVGYEEDSMGNVIETPESVPRGGHTDEPHVVYEPLSDGPGGRF